MRTGCKHVVAALLGFLPVLLVTRHLGWGLPGIWVGMGVFVGLRLIAVVARVRGDRWMVLGARTPGSPALPEVDG